LRDYACGLKRGDVIPTCDNLSNLFGYFKVIRTCETKLRYFDWDGQVHIAKNKTGGQQGDPLDMLIFNLTVHHIWGRVLAKFQRTRSVSYPDDGYIKGKLSVVLQVLVDLKRVLKEDAGLELHISKTVILPKAIIQKSIFDVAHGFINTTPQLTHLSGEVSLDSCPDDFGGWDVSSKDWTHMVLHLAHSEGGFGVPFNCVTKDVAFYTTTSRFVSWIDTFPQQRQELWLPIVTGKCKS
jgi:hypothetical protein